MKNVAITVLSVLVVGLSCFIVYDKVISKEDKKENNAVNENISESKITELSVSGDIVQNLYKHKLVSFTSLAENVLNKNYDEIKLVSLSDLTDDALIKLSSPERSKGEIVELTDEEQVNCIVRHTKFKEEDYREAIKEKFGTERANNVNFKTSIGDELSMRLFSFKYDSEAHEIHEYVGCGGFSVVEQNLTKAEEDSKGYIYLYVTYEIVGLSDNKETYTIKYTYAKEDEKYYFMQLEVIE